jgi:hypothetical protein
MAKQTANYEKGRRMGETWARTDLPCGHGQDSGVRRKNWRTGFIAGLRANPEFSAREVAELLAQSPSYLL